MVRKLLKTIDKWAYFKKAARIPTHLTPEEKEMLFKLSSKKAGVFVEIGSYLGASANYIAAGIKFGKKDGYLYCVDTWKNNAMSEGPRDTYLEFKKNISSSRKFTFPLRGKSKDVARTFGKAIDFLFIDGDHSLKAVKEDYKCWFPKLKTNSIVIFHDVGWSEGVQKVIKRYVSPKVKNEIYKENIYWAYVK